MLFANNLYILWHGQFRLETCKIGYKEQYDISYQEFSLKNNVIVFICWLSSTSSFQPEVSSYCSELMPLLLGYLSSLNQANIRHVTKAFYALENFMENLGRLKKGLCSDRYNRTCSCFPVQEKV